MKTEILNPLKSIIFFSFVLALSSCIEKQDKLPNIVIMLADDLGYGEIQHLNPERGKIPTPNLDAIARSGMIFTDAHGSSSVCTPTRYGMMTGRYHWRTRLQNGVLQGGESLISPDKLTLAKMLKKQGYHTAMFGKWHLGMIVDGKHKVVNDMDKGLKVEQGPIESGGFDEFHGFHHSGSMSTWIDNQEVTENVQPIDMLPRITNEAVSYIKERKDKDQPFFLYIPWNSPHAPVVPSLDWQGKSGLNAHADFVMQTDDSYGRVIQALKDNGLLENTLVIVSSDNGTSAPTSNMKQLNEMGHFPSANLRGSKADIWDGGHRIPFFASWPKKIKPDTNHDGIVCFTDVMATLADITGYKLTNKDGVDSESFTAAFSGQDTERNSIIHHSIKGYFSYRKGKWKMIATPGSGGWTKPLTNNDSARTAMNPIENYQLYDMDVDLGERENLADQNPDKVKEMRLELAELIREGSTTEGKTGINDVGIAVEKWGPDAVLVQDEFTGGRE